MTPLSLVLSRPPPCLVLANTEAIDAEALSPKDKAKQFAARLEVLMNSASERLKASQDKYKQDFDKKVREFNKELKPGDFVFIRRETAKESDEFHKEKRSNAIAHHKL